MTVNTSIGVVPPSEDEAESPHFSTIIIPVLVPNGAPHHITLKHRTRMYVGGGESRFCRGYGSMGPSASTLLFSDDASEFHFLVGLLSLHVPMAPTASKRDLHNNQMVYENRFGWSLMDVGHTFDQQVTHSYQLGTSKIGGM